MDHKLRRGLRVQKFRKRPVMIEAIQYRGQYTPEIKEFLTQQHRFDNTRGIEIATLEGVMLCEQFDWIIKGVQGEFYPCKPDIFEATYILVEEEIT